MNNTEEYCPTNEQEWRKWLDENHQNKTAVWLVYHKKNSPHYNLNWSQAVDQALCFGWIDSTSRPIDELRYKQYFSRRKPKSNWSKINKDKIELLIENGLMREAGLKSIEIAKENGSWTILDKIEALEVPDDLAKAFSENEGSETFYEGLSNSIKKQMLYWIDSAKLAETRQKRIKELVAHFSNGQRPKQFR
ncbi:MAG: YdeI/OmpD-associated family protein [Bacteroidetes bacterium]|nr:YdeI/OmpD-associated family protein [Bacteroidota bacterium]